MGAESCGKPERIVHTPILSGLGDSQVAQGLIGHLEVGNRRDDAVLQRLDRHGVLDPSSHRMPGISLGIGDQNLVCRLSEGRP